MKHTSSRTNRTSAAEVVEQFERESPGADLLTVRIFLRLWRIGKLLEKETTVWARERFNLARGDLAILMALRRSGAPYALRPTDLFRSLLVSSGGMTKQLDRLSERGFICRDPDPGHAGGFIIRLTDGGRALADQAAREVVSVGTIPPVILQLTLADRKAVDRVLDRLLSLAEDTEARSAHTRRGDRMRGRRSAQTAAARLERPSTSRTKRRSAS